MTVRDQLIWKALCAVDEAAEVAVREPIAGSFALRFALAFLYTCGNGERWPYDRFWSEIRDPLPTDGRMCVRRTLVTTAFHAVMRNVGVVPTPAAEADLRRRVALTREMWGRRAK